MSYFVGCFLIFAAAYSCNMIYVSVFYHRGFTHRAITMKPVLKKFVILSSSWITGLDLKSWVCMHRRHHAFVDTEKDPHSPVFYGVLGVFPAQHWSFQKTILGLVGERSNYTSFVEDLDFPVSWLNQYRLCWLLPMLLHFGILAVFWLAGLKLMGVCYFLGIISHPVQGFLVNSICHRFGYRNYNTEDKSTNQTLVGLLCFGEGYHNNHHNFPNSAKFSRRWFEFDMGYLTCLILNVFGLIEFNESKILVPQPLPSPDALTP